MKHSSVRTQSFGFTLLEVMLALVLLAMIVGMVLGLSRTSLALGKSIVQTQNAEMERQAFFDLLRDRFSSLPGNTRFDLKSSDSGSTYMSDLTMQNVPMSFTWGGQDRVAKAVQISTVKKRSGFFDVVLRYYEFEVLENSASQTRAGARAEEPFAEIVLLSGLAYFEWQALNSTTMEWQYEWEDQSRLPLQLELSMAQGLKGQPIRYVFWLPPKQNPELSMRQLQQNRAGAQQPGGAATEQPGAGDIQLEPGKVVNEQGGDQ